MIGISQHLDHLRDILYRYIRHITVIIVPLIIKTSTKGYAKQKQYNTLYFHNITF